jgi:hypothetical protein
MQIRALKPFINLEDDNKIVKEGETVDLSVKHAERLIKSGVAENVGERTQDHEPKRNRRDRQDDGGNFGN